VVIGIPTRRQRIRLLEQRRWLAIGNHENLLVVVLSAARICCASSSPAFVFVRLVRLEIGIGIFIFGPALRATTLRGVWRDFYVLSGLWNDCGKHTEPAKQQKGTLGA
jgi:hypothetical protein